MIFEATVDGREMRVEVQGKGNRYLVRLGDRRLDVDFAETSTHFASLLIGGRSHEVGLERRPDGYLVLFPEDTLAVRLQAAARGDAGTARHAASGSVSVLAPMPGKIVRVLAGPGDAVVAGQGLVVMEAMKMENELRAPRAGRVRETRVAEGQAVEGGALLVLLD